MEIIDYSKFHFSLDQKAVPFLLCYPDDRRALYFSAMAHLEKHKANILLQAQLKGMLYFAAFRLPNQEPVMEEEDIPHRVFVRLGKFIIVRANVWPFPRSFTEVWEVALQRFFNNESGNHPEFLRYLKKS